MAVLKKGQFSLDIGFIKLGGDLTDDDRQCAWELYTEIATRVAVVGKRNDPTCNDYSGELYSESLDSLYAFFRECREIMKKFPVGRIKDPWQVHLGVFIYRMLSDVVRPFLEHWRGPYRAWSSRQQATQSSPYDLQEEFPQKNEFLADWSALRTIMRSVQRQLAKNYKLVPLD